MFGLATFDLVLKMLLFEMSSNPSIAKVDDRSFISEFYAVRQLSGIYHYYTYRQQKLERSTPINIIAFTLAGQ